MLRPLFFRFKPDNKQIFSKPAEIYKHNFPLKAIALLQGFWNMCF